jgi:transcriptional regulator with XRE-family HTH domain
MAARTSPTVRRRRLARELRRLRKEAGLTREEVADHVGIAPATVTKIENASMTPRVADIALMLELYKVDDDRREILMTLTRQSRLRGWWHQFSGAVPQWFEVYLGLEEEACSIRSYDPETIHGLLQTEDYIRAQIWSELQVPADEEIDRLVAVRTKRQERLTADDAPELWIVLNEAAIRRQVGGPETMREQLRHLIDVSRLRTVTLQILPFTAGAHPGAQGAFNLIGFPEASDPDIVYIEYWKGSIYLEREPDVNDYGQLFNHLRARALGPDESRALVQAVAEEMSPPR